MTKDAAWLLCGACLSLILCLLPKVKTSSDSPEVMSEYEEFYMNLTEEADNVTKLNNSLSELPFEDTQLTYTNETDNNSNNNSSSNSWSSYSSSINKSSTSSSRNSYHNNSSDSSNSNNTSDSSIEKSNISDVTNTKLISTEQDIFLNPPDWEPVDSIIITNCSYAESLSMELYDQNFHDHDDVNTFYLQASLSQPAAFSLADDILNVFKKYFSLNKCQLEIVLAVDYMGDSDTSISESIVKYVIYYKGQDLKITDESEMVIVEKLRNYPIKFNYGKTSIILKDTQSPTTLPTTIQPQESNQGLPWALIIILCAIVTFVILFLSMIFLLCQKRRKGHYKMKNVASSSEEEQEVDLNDEETRSCEGHGIELKSVNEEYHIVPF